MPFYWATYTSNPVNFMMRAWAAAEGRGQLDAIYFDLKRPFDIACDALGFNRLT